MDHSRLYLPDLYVELHTLGKLNLMEEIIGIDRLVFLKDFQTHASFQMKIRAVIKIDDDAFVENFCIFASCVNNKRCSTNDTF